MRRLFIGIALVALVVLAAACAAWLYARSSLPEPDARLSLSGLHAEVRIGWDSLGVPHITAADEHDLLFAQGFVHARDRLWQMELLRRVLEGRLAELFGEDYVDTDTFLRTIGLMRAARASEATLEPTTLVRLAAYVDGINAAIESLPGALPPEFVLLGIQPEPWTLTHVLGVEKVMSWDLADYGTGIALGRAIRRLGPERARWLFPASHDWGATIVEPPELAHAPAQALALLDAFSMTRASNAWVIAGSRTRSGRPILANDMHLALQAPPIWYLVALHGGGYDIAGMSLPGVPFVVAGHNRAIAWGFSNAGVDDVDLFIERIDPADDGRYLSPEGSAPFDVLVDTIRVKDGEPREIRIRSTRHGPVLPASGVAEDGEVIALSWAASRPSHTVEALPAMNLAESWGTFLAAVRDFDNPHQNIVYADTAGHSGYVMGGRVPIRGDGLPAPLAPVPGWTGEYDWSGELPFERHPRLLDPASGYVVTANNRQVRGPEGLRIGSHWAEPFRALRIREMILAADEPFTAATVHAMQLDFGDAMAARYRHRAVAAAEAAGLDTAAALLRGWDLRAASDSRAAALFYVWFDQLRLEAARSLNGGSGWFPDYAVTATLERASLPWEERDGDVAYDSAARVAMQHADSIVAGRTWGSLNQVIVEHPLGQVELLDGALDLNIGPGERGGSSYTVNVSNYGGRTPPYRTTHAASQRHVVDMANIDVAGGFILPGGQSGNPLSEHYADQFDAWLDGGLWRIPLDADAAAARIVSWTVLRPM